MPVLHLGVVDVPYSQASARRGGKVAAGQATTGDVAGWLENKYHVMEQFAALHEVEIVGAVENSLEGAFESLVMGASFRLDPFASGMSKIEDAFRLMLSSRELESVGYPGVPTAAAQRGVNHRKKRPYVKRDARPSFVDTGLYSASFRAWVDG